MKWGFGATSLRGEIMTSQMIYFLHSCNQNAHWMAVSHWGPWLNASGIKCTNISLVLLSWSLSRSFSHCLATWEGYQWALCPQSWQKQSLADLLISIGKFIGKKCFHWAKLPAKRNPSSYHLKFWSVPCWISQRHCLRNYFIIVLFLLSWGWQFSAPTHVALCVGFFCYSF